MKRVKNKKGSHVDVILSFVIFVSFMILLYALLQPSINARTGKTAFLDFMGQELIKNLTGGDLTRISTQIYFQGALGQNCITLQGFLTQASISTNLVIKNSTGSTLESSYNGNNLYIYGLDDAATGELFSIYNSSSFNPIPGFEQECKDLTFNGNPNGYFIRQVENYSFYDYVWVNNVKGLIENYDNNYNLVKNSFSLTSSQNFRFDFTYSNQTVIGTENNIPSTVSVYSQIFPVVYISEEGPLEAGNLRVSVW